MLFCVLSYVVPYYIVTIRTLYSQPFLDVTKMSMSTVSFLVQLADPEIPYL